MNYIRKHWRGEFSLSISFWINVFLIGIITAWLNYWFTESSLFTHPVIAARFTLIIIFIKLCFVWPWQIVGLWRACKKHVVAHGRSFWTRTVQIIVVIVIISILGVISSSWREGKDLYQVGFQKDRWPDYTLILRNNDSLIHLDGGLRFGVSKDVAVILKNNPSIKGIILDSNGGSIYEGRELSMMILSYGLDTYSLKGCYSAGTMAFISGTNRFLATGANLGFHKYHAVYESLLEPEVVKEEQGKDLHFFEHRGINREFLEKIYAASHKDVWIPSIDELLDAGVIHGVINPSDLIKD